MYDLTSNAGRFRERLAVGDLLGALGLDASASKLQIDVAAARLAERSPSLAFEATAVANVLRQPRRLAVYRALQNTCDQALAAFTNRYGDEVATCVPDRRQKIWQYGCRLFRFEIAGSEAPLGAQGLESLAKRGVHWLAAALLADSCEILHFHPSERVARIARRDRWLERCPQCGATGWAYYRPLGNPAELSSPRRLAEATRPASFNAGDYVASVPTHCRGCKRRMEPVRCDDIYAFQMTPDRALVRGEGIASGGVVFVWTAETTVAYPAALVERFFRLQAAGHDVTLDRAGVGLGEETATRESPLLRRRRLAIAMIALIVGRVCWAVWHVPPPPKPRPPAAQQLLQPAAPSQSPEGDSEKAGLGTFTEEATPESDSPPAER